MEERKLICPPLTPSSSSSDPAHPDDRRDEISEPSVSLCVSLCGGPTSYYLSISCPVVGRSRTSPSLKHALSTPILLVSLSPARRDYHYLVVSNGGRRDDELASSSCLAFPFLGHYRIAAALPITSHAKPAARIAGQLHLLTRFTTVMVSCALEVSVVHRLKVLLVTV